ncbi:MAG: family type secretion target [Thermoleophilia bacterium]|nr:family type secretion target [Thermoleophilia bacterium]
MTVGRVTQPATGAARSDAPTPAAAPTANATATATKADAPKTAATPEVSKSTAAAHTVAKAADPSSPEALVATPAKPAPADKRTPATADGVLAAQATTNDASADRQATTGRTLIATPGTPTTPRTAAAGAHAAPTATEATSPTASSKAMAFKPDPSQPSTTTGNGKASPSKPGPSTPTPAPKGTDLDAKFTEAQRTEMRAKQDAMEAEAKAAATPDARRDTRADYYAATPYYVEDDGTIYAATYARGTGDLTIARKDTVDTKLDEAAASTAKQGQDQLAKDVSGKTEEQRRQVTAAYYTEHPVKVETVGGTQVVSKAIVDPQSGNVSFEEQPSSVEMARENVIHDDGSRTNVATATSELSADGHDVSTITQDIDPSGTVQQTRTTRDHVEHGSEPGNGTKPPVATTHVINESGTYGANGLPITEHRSEIQDVDGVSNESVSVDSSYDAKGLLTKQAIDEQVTDATSSATSTTTTSYTAGIPVSSHSESAMTGPLKDGSGEVDLFSTIDRQFNSVGEPTSVTEKDTTRSSGTVPGSGDTPTEEWEQLEERTTTLSNAGKPIFDEYGAPLVKPAITYDNTYTSTLKGAGYDDDFDLVTVKKSHADNADSAELEFDRFAHVTQTSYGKDSDGKGVVSTWDTPVDPKTGATVTEPPADWWPADGSGDWDVANYGVSTYYQMESPKGPDWKPFDELSPAEQSQWRQKWLAQPDLNPEALDMRRELWQHQNSSTDDNKSGWRKFKDGATQALAVVSAVAGVGLLFTGVGTAFGAGLLAVSAGAGAIAFGSTVSDYVSGRNHVSGTDVALSGAMLIPGVGGGLARTGAALAEGASTVARLEGIANAANTAGKAATGAYATYSTASVVHDAITGQPVSGLDLLNVFAAWGGAKHAFGAKTGGNQAEVTQATQRSNYLRQVAPDLTAEEIAVLSKLDVEHVFEGNLEVGKSGEIEAQGVHWAGDGSELPANVKVTPKKPPKDDRAYSASVQITATDGTVYTKPTGSTMFPANWSRTEVLRAIKAAYEEGVGDTARHSPGQTPGSSVFNGDYRGFKIKIVVDAQGNIVTAFPLNDRQKLTS